MIMPMIKKYTLSYCFNTSQNQQVSHQMAGCKGPGGDRMPQSLNGYSFSPSVKSVQEILDFSRSYEVLHSSLTRGIEMFKN